MAYENLLYDKSAEGIATITLNRPEKLNALDLGLLKDIRDVLDEIQGDDEVRVVVLTGAGRAFSAGFDISPGQMREDMDATLLWDYTNLSAETVTKIRDLRQPTIAAVAGFCLAAGHTLAHSCDIVIAAENAQFGEPEIRHVAHTPAPILPYIMPMRQAYWLYYTGDTIDAQTALSFNMVSKVVPTESLNDATLSVARRIALVPPFAAQMMKRSIQTAYDNMGYTKTIRDHLMIRQMQGLTPDVLEREMLNDIREEQGLRAFLEVRDGPFAADESGKVGN